MFGMSQYITERKVTEMSRCHHNHKKYLDTAMIQSVHLLNIKVNISTEC